MARTTRRGLLHTTGRTTLAGIVAAVVGSEAQASETLPVAPDHDGPLLAMSARFLQLQNWIDASYSREAERYRELKRQGASCETLSALEAEGEVYRGPHEAEQRPLLDRITELPARTLAGQQARARVLMRWYGLGKGGEYNVALDWDHLEPLFKDLLGEVQS